ncbi:MAG: hypothetical protein ABIJ40_20880 [Bacteroidota bacterium]
MTDDDCLLQEGGGSTESHIKRSRAPKRRFLEVDEEVANKVQIFCFLKDTTIKRFVTDAMKKELDPYEHWLENVSKLKGECED